MDTSHALYVSYPSHSDVSEEHRNVIILANYFTMKPGRTDKQIESDRILLKVFPLYIYSEERQMYLDEKLNLILHVMPLEYYDPTQYDYDNSTDFEKLKLPENWITDLPLDQEVLVYYTKAESVGCEHYIRGCQLRCETCKKYFSCRICHDAAVDDHRFDRYAVRLVKCRYCDKEQPFGQNCVECKRSFGWYICYECKMICGLGEDAKPNYHCEGCKMCMVGRRENAKHCYKCNSCYAVDFYDYHNCRTISGDCCVCMEDCTNSIYGRVVPDCGHVLHSHCYQMLISKGIYKCPICKRFMPKDEEKTRIVDWIIDVYHQIFIPREFEDYFVKCKCNDCLSEFSQEFHPFKYFCSKCKNFNVEVIGDSSRFEYMAEDNGSQWQTPMVPNANCCGAYLLKKFQKLKYLEKCEREEDQLEYICQQLGLDLEDEFDQNTIAHIANNVKISNIEDFKQAILEFRANIPQEESSD